jgi:putative Ca2+/H+ antiporter (TMEM165/GDT1 family)
VNVLVALTVFAAIFPAELPDKTFVATLVLSTRFPATLVWVGAAAAFVVQTAVAVAAGGALALLPHRPVHAVTAVLFAVGAVAVLLAKDAQEEEQEVAEELAATPARATAWRAALTSFLILFVAEWGDLTQLLTAAFAAKYHDVVSVATGALAALWAVAALGVLGGRTLLRIVPVVWVQRVAAGVFAALAAVTAVEAIRG